MILTTRLLTGFAGWRDTLAANQAARILLILFILSKNKKGRKQWVEAKWPP